MLIDFSLSLFRLGIPVFANFLARSPRVREGEADEMAHASQFNDADIAKATHMIGTALWSCGVANSAFPIDCRSLRGNIPMPAFYAGLEHVNREDIL